MSADVTSAATVNAATASSPPGGDDHERPSRWSRMRESGQGWFMAYLGMFLQLAGSYAIGIGLSHVFLPGSPTAASRLAAVSYQAAACPACPREASITSVEVQQREGSTLFIARGNWPATVDKLHEQIRLDAGDISVVIKPHGSQNAFEIVSLTKAGQPFSDGRVSAGIVSGALIIDVKPQLSTPVAFDLGLWSGSYFVQRLPSTDKLSWSGQGAPQLGGAGAAPTMAAPAAPSRPAILSEADACAFNNQVPAYLQLTGVAAGPAADPFTGTATMSIAARSGSSIPGASALPPFTVIGVVTAKGVAPGTGPVALDRLGNEQIVLRWNGHVGSKALRTWNPATSQWTTLPGSATTGMNVQLTSQGVIFYWSGLHSGDAFGFLVATASGCSTTALDPTSRQPVEII